MTDNQKKVISLSHTVSRKERDTPLACPTDWRSFGTYCYLLGTNLVDEPISESACQDSGVSKSILLSVHSIDENSFLSSW